MDTQVLDLPTQQELKKRIAQGLPMTLYPYQTLAEELGCSEASVIATLTMWQQTGLIKRFGVVVKHRSLGYSANAMVVWDVPDELVDKVGEQLGNAEVVTLCYQRPRVLPHWPYNLFTMIHGQNRHWVRQQIHQLIETYQLHHINYDILFSRRAFKQCGGAYGDATKQSAQHSC